MPAPRRPTLCLIFGAHVLSAPALHSLAAMRHWCDEILVGLDERVPAADLARFGAVADVLVTYPYTAPNEFRGWLRDQTQAEWLLFLDGDEMVSQSLAERLSELVADRLVAGYHLPRRWLFGGHDQYLSSRPWSPDYQLRLVRNDDRLFFRAVKHTGPETTGPTRRVAEPLLHLDLLSSDYDTRRAKVARYEGQHFGHLTGGVPTNAAYYLPEDDPLRVVSRLAPADAAVCCDTPVDGAPVGVSIRATVVDIRRSVEWTPLGEDRQGRLEVIEAPAAARAGVVFTVTVLCTNLGGRTWPRDPERPPLVRLSYHWMRNDVIHTFDGVRSLFQSPIAPGNSVEVDVGVEAPSEPGRYKLVLDLVEEGVQWFGIDTALPIEVQEAPREVLARCAVGGRVPLREVLRLRRELIVPDAVQRGMSVADAEITDPRLREWVSGLAVGGWALDGPTLKQVVDMFDRSDARPVLEFGSGTSTVVLAQAARAAGREGISVVSIEQSADECRRISNELAARGVGSRVVLVHAPVVQVSLGEATLRCYDPEAVNSALEGRSPQLIVIDGPSSASGANRYHTLLMAQRCLRRPAQFLLDDAWRDTELSVAEAWLRQPGVRIDGVMLIGKGALVGTVEPLQPA